MFSTQAAQFISNYSPFLAQDHVNPVLRPAQMPVSYGMQAASVLGSVRGQPAQMPAIPPLVPLQFQTGYSVQSVPFEISNLPGSSEVHVPLQPYREGEV